MFVGRVHKVTKEIIDELLCHGTRLHIGFHINIRYTKTGIFQHGLYRDHVRMNFSPGHRFHGYINNISTILTNFKNGSH